jgi:hypothetical protein
VVAATLIDVFNILWRIWSLLGNCSVKRFPWRQILGEQFVAGRWKYIFLGYGVLNVFSVRGPCRRIKGDNEDYFQSVVEREAEWREASAIKEEEFSWRKLMRSSSSLRVCVYLHPPYQRLDAGANIYKTWCVCHITWTHLNGLLIERFHQSVCLYVYPPMVSGLFISSQHVSA